MVWQKTQDFYLALVGLSKILKDFFFRDQFFAFRLGIVTFCILIFTFDLNAQNISINGSGTAPDSSAMLDISDTTRGLLVPRLTFSQRNLVANPATGLLIFQTNADSGFYYNNGTTGTPNWTRLKTDSDSSFWSKKDTNLYFNTGGVGIGIDTPMGLLQLYGNGNFGAGSRIIFGDDYRSTSNDWNAFVGESGWDSEQDSDQLQVHGSGGTFFTVGGGSGGNELDTAAVINSFGRLELYQARQSANFLRMFADTGQVGVWFNNDSAYWALFSESRNGSFMPQGAVGLFGGLNAGTRALRWVVDVDGNMGIGTSTPLTQVDIIDTGIVAVRVGSDQTDQFMKLDYNTSAGFSSIQSGLFGGTTHPLILQGGGGDVGIRTTSPRKELHVNGSIIAESSNLASLPTGLTYALLTNNNGESLLSSSSGSKSESLKINGSTISFSSGISNFSNPTVMFIDTGGNVGMGTTTPAEKLEIDGSIFLNSTSPSLWLVGNSDGTTNHLRLHHNSNDGYIQWNGGNLYFREDNTPRMIINSGGRVGIGSTNPNAMLTIEDSGGNLNSGLQLQNGNDDWYIYQNATFGLTVRDDGNDRVYIDASGNVGIGESTPAYKLEVAGDINALGGSIRSNGGVLISDKRYKTNIVPLTEVLPLLMELQGVYHNWDSASFPEMNFTQKRTIGVIAQEIQKVFPELVSEGPDGYLGVEYSKFTAVLLQAIKEQQDLINQQNQNNDKQQNQIDILINEVKQLKKSKDE